MSINKAKIKEFFKHLEQEAEDDAAKALAAVGLFLRSTMTALAHDPAVTAAVQAGMGAAISEVAAAVATGGASVLPAAALAAGRALVIAAGGTAAHELVPIVAGELHAAVAGSAASIPEHVNP